MSDKIVTVERGGQPFQFKLEPTDFSIDPSHIDTALCNAGQIMLQYGELEAEVRAEVARKDAHLDQTYADLDSNIRVDAKQNGTKVTENQIKNEILSNPAYQVLMDGLRESQSNQNVMRWEMNALNKKTDCLIAMAYRERQLMKMEM